MRDKYVTTVVVDAIGVDDLCKRAAKGWSNLPDWVVSALKQGVLDFTDTSIAVRERDCNQAEVPRSHYLVKGFVTGRLFTCNTAWFKEHFKPVPETPEAPAGVKYARTPGETHD